MLRMDQVHVIRHKVLREGTSIRQVAHELGLSRNTVSKYLEQSVPGHRTYRRRKRPVWGRVQSRLESIPPVAAERYGKQHSSWTGSRVGTEFIAIAVS